MKAGATLWLVMIFCGLKFHDPRISVNTMCKAAAVFGEARGEPVAGQRLVVRVIDNRVASPRWPNTACAVVFQPHQFAGIRYLQHGRMPYEINPAAWRMALSIASHSRRVRGCEGVTYFIRAGTRAAWRASVTAVCHVGNQVYMRSKR